MFKLCVCVSVDRSASVGTGTIVMSLEVTIPGMSVF
jgi:hypothetical protein